jgi:regulatory protein
MNLKQKQISDKLINICFDEIHEDDYKKRSVEFMKIIMINRKDCRNIKENQKQ